MTEKQFNAVIRAFDAAASTYDAASQLQRDVARALVARAARDIARPPETILDLGCGAGHVTEAALRQWPGADVTALDAAPNMLAALGAKFPATRTIRADADAPPELGRFDLVLSSMMAHWLPDPRASLARWRALLAPGGGLNVALPVAGSLPEWRDALIAERLTDALWRFPPADFASGMCDAIDCVDFVATHAGAKTFLQSLKATGARRSPQGHRPASAAALRRVLERHRGPFAATFRIAFLTLSPEVPPAPRPRPGSG